ncbi:MAG: hypothetical protein AMJ79_06200 [Phycisphaerae bacterium SM23_30]|nr:MAG: hypothetical protein AMJ79_06200 [Phycisphaerae bacterium SM23_30]
MLKRQHTRALGFSGTGLTIIFILLVSLLITVEALGQGRGRSRRSSPGSGSGTTPAPRSEINLNEISYKIAYETYRPTNGKNNWEIYLINADGSNPVNLTNTPEINEFYPHASPDGTKICFVADEGTDRRNRSRNVYYINIDGSRRTLVAQNGRQPCWSPDGKSLAYLKGEYSRYSSDAASNRGLYIYNLETKKHRQHPNQRLSHLFNLCWSSDGKWFTATSRGWGSGNIAIGIDGTGDKSLGIRGCRPDISPDGQKLSWGRTDYDLQIGNLDLSSRRPVTNEKTVVSCQRGYKVYHVDWSPDGKYLTFSYGPSRGSQAVGSRAAGWNICVYDIAADKWVQVTTDGNHNKEPDWVPVKTQNPPAPAPQKN